jgi:hypothetical protein
MGKTLETFLHALNSSDHYQEPYAHWTMSNCLPTATCEAIRSLPFPAPEIADTEGKRDSHNESRQFFSPSERQDFPVVDDLASALQSPECISALQTKCGADLEDTFLRIEYTQDTGGFWLGPHTDVGPKKFTMMIYLSTDAGCEEWGTDILDSDHEIVRTVKSPYNAGMIFIPSNNTWHGFHRRLISGIRRSLIVNYVTTEWRNRHELAFPDKTVTASGASVVSVG